ncbi:MAG: hypothetical protein M1288_03275 [Actinobacteria bacterium]|nr:hypothetical protein [Actinomycetota bacterium]
MHNICPQKRTVIGYPLLIASLALLLSSCAYFTQSKSSPADTAIGASQLQNGSTSTSKTSAQSIYIDNLTGVDTQITFSTSVGSGWTNRKLIVSSINPASVESQNGQKTLSVPITGGHIEYQEPNYRLVGIVTNSGGIKIQLPGYRTFLATNFRFDFLTHQVTALIDNQKVDAIFTIHGKPRFTMRSGQKAIDGLWLELSPFSSQRLRNFFPKDTSLGQVVITISGAP